MTQQKTRKTDKKSLKNKKLKNKPATTRTTAARHAVARKTATAQNAKPRVVVRNSPIHGRGVFAVNAIAKGARILEYTGERMSHAEADRRYSKLHEGSSHTMLFAANDDVVIDATRRGGPARWINHSCAPNCEADEEDGRVFINAIRAIRPGEELSYDYNLVLEERHTPRLKREHPCHCGARQCRRTLLGSKR